MFVGNGFDIHKHSKDENLILGGVYIDGDGFEAHSDGDIILHSLCDALLGSKAKKDFEAIQNIVVNIISHLIKLHQKIFRVSIC